MYFGIEWNFRCCEGDFDFRGRGSFEEERRYVLGDLKRVVVLKFFNVLFYCLGCKRILVGGCVYCFFYVICDRSSNVKII